MKRAKKQTEIHFRRCHQCDTINECDQHEVKVCNACRKPVAPFYFFSDVDVVAHSDNELRPDRAEGKIKPVLGFTAYW